MVVWIFEYRYYQYKFMWLHYDLVNFMKRMTIVYVSMGITAIISFISIVLSRYIVNETCYFKIIMIGVMGAGSIMLASRLLINFIGKKVYGEVDKKTGEKIISWDNNMNSMNWSTSQTLEKVFFILNVVSLNVIAIFAGASVVSMIERVRPMFN